MHPDSNVKTEPVKTNLLSAEEIDGFTVTSEIARRYRERYPDLSGDELAHVINSHFGDDWPPVWEADAFLSIDYKEQEQEHPRCEDCGELSWDCERYSEEAAEQWKEYAEQVKAAHQNERESDVSIWQDGDETFHGQHYEPVIEQSEDGCNETCEDYFGGHTFGRDHGITQLIRAASEASGVPEPFCALMVLFAFSSALGKGLQVSFKDGELTSLGIFILAFARSGAGKTKVGKYLLSALTDLHNERRQEWETAIKPKLDVKKKTLGSKLARLQKQYEKEESDELLDQMVTVQTDLDRVDRELNAPMIYLEDVTVERLVSLLPLSGEQMTYYSSDAGAAIQNVLGKYNKDSRPDDHVLLKSYSLESFTQARLTRDDVSLEAPWGSLLWMTQPDKWDHLRKNEWLREGGFLPRCLLVQFDISLQHDDGNEKTVPEPLVTHYTARFRELFNAYRKPAESGAEPKIIPVSKEAREMMREFHNEIIDYRRDNTVIDAFAARWVENAKRIAGVLHAAYWGAKAHEEPLHWVTAMYAIKAMRWFMKRQGSLLQSHVEEVEKQDVEKFRELFWANGWCVRMRDAVRLRIPEKDIRQWVEDSKTVRLRNGDASPGLKFGDEYDGTYTEHKMLKITKVQNPNGTVTEFVHHWTVTNPQKHVEDSEAKGTTKKRYRGR